MYYLIFFAANITKKNPPKNQLSCTQKIPNFWQASDRVITVDASFFRSSRSQMFYKIDFLKDFGKTQKRYLCRIRSPCFNNVAGLQKEIPSQIFSRTFCKIFKNTSELLLLRFEEVVIKIDVNICTYIYIYIYIYILSDCQ